MGRMAEMNKQSSQDLSEAWVRQQLLHRVAGNSKAEGAWATEFGTVSHQSLQAPFTQYDTSARPYCR